MEAKRKRGGGVYDYSTIHINFTRKKLENFFKKMHRAMSSKTLNDRDVKSYLRP